MQVQDCYKQVITGMHYMKLRYNIMPCIQSVQIQSYNLIEMQNIVDYVTICPYTYLQRYIHHLTFSYALNRPSWLM